MICHVFCFELYLLISFLMCLKVDYSSKHFYFDTVAQGYCARGFNKIAQKLRVNHGTTRYLDARLSISRRNDSIFEMTKHGWHRYFDDNDVSNWSIRGFHET